MKTLKFFITLGIISLGLLSFNKLIQEEWKIPDKYQKMKNSTEANDENLSIDKIYPVSLRINV